MDVTTLSKSEDKTYVEIEVKDITPAFANAIRRYIMEKVPTMAVEEVEFRKNSSVLYDEIVAHRIGLIPLKTDLKSYNLPDKCKCEGAGCAKCQLKLTLTGKGPGVLTASKIKTQDPNVRQVHDDMPVVKLLKNQQLQIEATAQLGLGEKHVKWSPGIVTYRFSPIITVNNESKKFDEFKDKYPKQIFGKDGKIDKDKIIDLNLVDACEGVCKDIVKVEYDEKKIIIRIESFGQLTPKQMVNKGSELLDEDLDELSEKIKSKE